MSKVSTVETSDLIPHEQDFSLIAVQYTECSAIPTLTTKCSRSSQASRAAIVTSSAQPTLRTMLQTCYRRECSRWTRLRLSRTFS